MYYTKVIRLTLTKSILDEISMYRKKFTGITKKKKPWCGASELHSLYPHNITTYLFYKLKS